MEMKQNQTFFHGKYSNLTSFFLGCKILKYFNDFYNCHLSVSLQKWAQTKKSELKSNRHVKAHSQAWDKFSQLKPL